MRRFLDTKLARYPDDRANPSLDGTSRLSPWLHFGHISVHEILGALIRREEWSPERLSRRRPTGKREGWWGMSPPAEAWLDELITWREIAFNLCASRDGFDRYESVPAWARTTLEAHSIDRRPRRYTLRQLESAETHDPIWNAAQTQMLRDGWFHNHMRMLWGKKILEWSPSPRAALRAMAELMGKHSLDGRNPCSWAGYLWILGRYDRPWGPERPIFGTVRFMSSESLARKVRLAPYLRLDAPPAGTPG